ncbi:lysozyme [Undibacterium sp.]|uniref:lysozyme n=1 Tax=Undibacterium sp. TaxID=1914977 RepID=UPI003753D00D
MSETKNKLVAKIGAGAVALLVPLAMFFEGTVNKTYKDPIGILTACTGHTGADVKVGQTYTDEQCREMLYADLLKHADDIDCIKAPLNDAQKAALISFGFNVGKQKLCTSTLAKKANAGDMIGACNELRRWTLAGGKELPGLVRRREAERQMCMRGAA